MERRSCSNLHFINAIKGNLVSKIRNVNTCGKPALVFKTVKEIMEALDSKKLQPSTSQAARCLDLEFSCARVKIESFCLPQVERSLKKFDRIENESACCDGDDGTCSDSDDDNDERMTLKQLKERFKTKKRKHANYVDFKQCSKLEPEEDDSDLREPLSSLKLKLPRAKRKCVQAASQSPKDEALIKSEQNLDAEMQPHRNLTWVVRVKTEVPEPLILEYEHKTHSVENLPHINQSDESSIAKAVSDGAPKTSKCQSSKSKLFAEQYLSCSVNEVSYDHLDDVEPICPPFPSSDNMDVDGQEEACQQSPDSPTSECEIEEVEEQPLLITWPTKDENSYMTSFSRSLSRINEFLGQKSCHDAVLASNLGVDDCISGEDLSHGSDSLLFSDDAKQDLASDQEIDTTRNPGSTTDLVSFEDKSTLDEHEQNKKPVAAGEGKQERVSSLENQNCDVAEIMSTSVQPPERLLLTRKVISPTSEERLCLAMSSAGPYANQDSKENPRLGNQTENKAFSVGSDFRHANVAGNPKESSIINQPKVIISPTRTAKPSKNARRNSPPKGNLEGPRLCRSIPSVSTGCTSLQGCSESAIAFSRRQMHDIESLAVKLMSELKYMKEIVEEKLLFEAYRNASAKNVADEVKDAITSAAKVEETARKWLSMMARDCSRFCKIMSLTQEGTDPATPPNNGIQRERKKITFADEAGGKLCHVKVFGNEMNLESTSEKQTTQAV